MDIYKDGIPCILTPQQAITYNDGVVFSDMEHIMTLLKNSDSLCFIFPVWMYGLPSPIKGVLEKIVRPDITFSIRKDGVMALLDNIKQVSVICSSGQQDRFGSLEEDPVYYTFRHLINDNFDSNCGFSYNRLFGTDHLNSEKLERFNSKIREEII